MSIPFQMRTIIVLVFLLASTKAEKCLSGKHHKNASSPATKEYAECKAWSKDTCCTAKFAQTLKDTETKELYGFHWGHCKDVSKECQQFLVEEECFWSCEPKLIRWQATNTSVKGVPICGDYCNAWYEACKYDQTCVKDWQIGFNYSNDMYTCPKVSECLTFEKVYGSGKELCNTMWGKSFVYVDSTCPCSRMDGPIPKNVNEDSICSRSTRNAMFSAIFLLVLLGVQLAWTP